MRTMLNHARMMTAVVALALVFASSAGGEEMELTLEQALELALGNNPDMKAANFDLDVARNDIIRAKAAYDPYIQIDSSYTSSRRPTSQSAFGRESESTSVSLSSGVATPTGGSLSLDFRNSIQESDSFFMTLNPSYNSDLTLSVRQPLLKNSHINLRKQDLTQKENDYMRVELALKSKTMEITSSVEDAYWSLVKAKMDLEVRRQSLAVTERLHEITQAQVQSGVLAPVSLVQSEASLASARASMIRIEGDYTRAQNNLKMLLYFKSEDDLRMVDILPVDEPVLDEQEINSQRSIDLAVENNISLKQAELNLENLKISNNQTRNRRLPQLDLNASVTLSGLAGESNTDPQVVQTGFVIPNPYPTPQPYIMETITITPGESDYQGDYADAVQNMLEADNTSYNASIVLNMPIGNRAARSDWRNARYNQDKIELEISKQKRNIIFTMESLLNDVQVARRSWEAASLARDLESQSLATEENKYRLGLSTHYQVMEAEERFADTQSTEIAALIEYNKTLGRLKRAEEGYLQAGGVGISIPSVSMAGLGSIGAGGLPSGISAGQIQSLMGSLPAGIDLNSLKAMGLPIP